jgi:hypothetical protein
MEGWGTKRPAESKLRKTNYMRWSVDFSNQVQDAANAGQPMDFADLGNVRSAEGELVSLKTLIELIMRQDLST